MRRLSTLIGVLAVAILPAVVASEPAQAHEDPAQAHLRLQPVWHDFDTGTIAGLRGLSAVSRRTAWASGTDGEVLRTPDGGRTWLHVGPPGTQSLQFRDIEAFDDQHAVIMAAGVGEDSRIYVTADGGATWTESFHNTEPTAFYDCMAFFDRSHGIALSDPVNGTFRILSTSDSGRTWTVLPIDGMPPALAGEFAFAASGTCVAAASGRHAWFATGGGAVTRVFHSDDRGLTWTAVDTPFVTGPTAGIYSLAFRDARHGIAVGGDFLAPTTGTDAAAWSADGGRTWRIADRVPGEYRSGVAWTILPSVAIAVGPTGSDITVNAGRTWQRFDSGNLDGVDCAADGACWGSGSNGRIARLGLTLS